MSDDIRDVMKSSPYPPVHRATRGDARERLSDERQGSQGEGRYSGDETPQEGSDPRELERLAAEVNAANARFQAAGRNVRLHLAGGQSAPVIDILVLDAAGAKTFSRRISHSEMAAWITRIETSEGLLLDDTL